MNEILKGFNDSDDKRFVGILLTAFCLITPTFGFFVVAAGLVPLWIYPLQMLVGGLFGIIVGGLHLLFYGAVFYGLAEGLTWGIFKVVRKPIARLIVLTALLIGFGVLALSPVYWPMSHSRTAWTNIFGVLSYGL